MLRRTAAAALTAVSLFTLVACGKNDSPAASTPSEALSGTVTVFAAA